MVAEVVYTEPYKFTLATLIHNIESGYGTSSAEKLLDRVDSIVEKIVINPYLFQAISIDNMVRRAVISPQSSLVYKIMETKIVLLYIFDNRRPT